MRFLFLALFLCASCAQAGDHIEPLPVVRFHEIIQDLNVRGQYDPGQSSAAVALATGKWNCIALNNVFIDLCKGFGYKDDAEVVRLSDGVVTHRTSFLRFDGSLWVQSSSWTCRFTSVFKKAMSDEERALLWAAQKDWQVRAQLERSAPSDLYSVVEKFDAMPELWKVLESGEYLLSIPADDTPTTIRPYHIIQRWKP